MKVSLVSGLFVERDAISGSLAAKLRALDGDRTEQHDVRIFAQGSDASDARVTVYGSPTDLALDAHFRESDLVSYEFGIAYELFDTLHLARQRATTVVTYHNLTPVELVDDPVTIRALRRAHVQRESLSLVDHVFNDSGSNARQLQELEIRTDSSSVLFLPAGPAAIGSPAERRPAASRVELLFVGRLVRSKGVLDLLDVLDALDGADIRLTVVGPEAFSSADLCSLVASRARSRPDRLRFLPDLADDELGHLYRSSHVLVMPSSHEGYGVPLVEAIASGCHVISYDNSNMPETCAGLGQLVPSGDVEALTATVADTVGTLLGAAGGPYTLPFAAGRFDDVEWRRRVREFQRLRSDDRFAATFLDTVYGLVESERSPRPDWRIS